MRRDDRLQKEKRFAYRRNGKSSAGLWPSVLRASRPQPRGATEKFRVRGRGVPATAGEAPALPLSVPAHKAIFG